MLDAGVCRRVAGEIAATGRSRATLGESLERAGEQVRRHAIANQHGRTVIVGLSLEILGVAGLHDGRALRASTDTSRACVDAYSSSEIRSCVATAPRRQ